MPSVKYGPKPRVPQVNWLHPLARGLCFSAELWEGGSTTVRDGGIQRLAGAFGATTAAPTWSVGQPGAFVSFDGGDRIEFGNYWATGTGASAIPVYMSVASLHRWTTSTLNVATVHRSNAGSSRQSDYGLRITATPAARFYVECANTTGYSCDGSTTLATGTWYLFVGVRYNTAMEVYVDGLLDGTATCSTGWRGGGSRLDIGGRNDQGNWPGDIAFVRIWNRPLTAREIQALAIAPWEMVTPRRLLVAKPPSSTVVGAAEVVATSALAVSGKVVVRGTADVTGTGVVAATGIPVALGAGAIAATSAVGAAGTVVVPGAGAITGTGAIAAAAVVVVPSAAAVTATSTLAASGLVVVLGAGSLVWTSTLLGPVSAVNGAASVGGTSAMTCSGLVVLPSSGSVVAITELSAAGVVVVLGNGALAGEGSLLASGLPIVLGQCGLGATFTIAVALPTAIGPILASLVLGVDVRGAPRMTRDLSAEPDLGVDLAAVARVRPRSG